MFQGNVVYNSVGDFLFLT